MMQLAESEKCSGCMACAAACPTNAISVCSDLFGNILPEIQSGLCIKCGKCRKVCPELTPLPAAVPQKAYAVWSLDAESRRTSASGGAAAEFYAKALQEGWWICGAEYSDDGCVIHTLSRDPDAIGRYKQSKYVYSDASCAFEGIKEKLIAGEKVIMISLPCKVAGLMGYLGKVYDNLLTVDIVCHGTPPYKILRDHIAHVAPGTESCKLRFRQDNRFVFHLELDGRTIYEKEGRTDTYLAAFLEGLSYRENCYHCRYADSARISDLTICDFWGLGAEIPFEYPYTGAVSAVLVNTDKGVDFFDSCRSALFIEERPVEEAVKGNAQLNHPTPRHPQRDEYERIFREQGFEATVSAVLKKEMRSAKKENAKIHLRRNMRNVAGIFLKRYRG